MKKLSVVQQKFLKIVHLISAGIWMAGVITITFMPYISKNIINGDQLYMYNKIFYFIDMMIVTPAAVITLITGLIYSIFTRWGFFKHGWLIYKWIVTLTLVLFGTFYLGPMVTNMLAISHVKRIIALEDTYYQYGLSVGLWASILNTTLLIVAVVFSVYKPWKNIQK